jgi:hypothetical protein
MLRELRRQESEATALLASIRAFAQALEATNSGRPRARHLRLVR